MKLPWRREPLKGLEQESGILNRPVVCFLGILEVRTLPRRQVELDRGLHA